MLSFSRSDVEQFYQTNEIETFAVRPDEAQIIFSTNLSGKFDLWAMDLPNHFPYRLTFNGQSVQTAHFDKQGRFAIVGYDHDGDENTALYAMRPQGGTLLPLRTHKDAFHSFAFLSEDGERLYYSSNKENAQFLNGYCYYLQSGEEELILEGNEAMTIIEAVGPEESSFVYSKALSNTYQTAYVHKGHEDIPLTPQTEEEHVVSDVMYVSDEEIYLITNYQSDYSYLAKFNLQTKEFSEVLRLEHEELMRVKFDRERHILYLIASRGVVDCLYQYDLTHSRLVQLDIPVDQITQLEIPESGNLYLLGMSATKPSNLYRYQLDGHYAAWEELTHNRVPGVDELEMVDPEVIRYPSFDGLEIEGLYFKANEENDNQHLIFWPHGGPQWAERKSFRALFQFLVYRGYSIFAPNFRGSTHYGLAFTKMVERDWGEGPRLDCVEGMEWMIEKGYVERDKILVMGGSFGGYMTLLLAGRHPEYVKAAVDIFGPSNLFTFLESVPEYWKPLMKRWLGDPEEDRERLVADSPLTYIDKMTKPLFIIQGANDPRVVQKESDQIVTALREKGIEVEYLVLEDEGHGFSKKENEIEVYRQVLQFFDQMVLSSK
ncbi:S9 family peptidase [Mechercharimyces sp. CAU 1602]|uniref:S9 family peptidase n=1 Tax=Mechercharimyces sp. CAU 1602 TaxID=2973933 RepID=UPI002161691D|nr:S9 family peptidase [Mechercharimyces sp. CAU 1602]MCS1350077.1 S9 family peptidase [Mechercharimyces sp. CAU 1602]